MKKRKGLGIEAIHKKRRQQFNNKQNTVKGYIKPNVIKKFRVKNSE